jgi:uncharacterized protein
MSGTPGPLTQFVLKVHSRCDLACDHCYVYEGPDQSWQRRPVAIPEAVARQAASRIAEHAQAHRLPAVQVILHGGEPLLARPPRLGRVIGELQSALRGICDLDLRIHTNGVLLDERTCELFAEHGVKVGISLDGYRAANDRHRRYADGRSSYDNVIAAIGLLRTSRFRHLYAGLLCTIDTTNDPVGVYEALVALDPPRIDFLLPHATWEHPPSRGTGAEAEYADWLTAIFDRWLADSRPIRIRTFDSVISTLRGGDSFTEALGLGPASLAVIETDGSYEQADSLKTAYDGAPATGLDVFRHSLDQVAEHSGIAARQQGLAALCQACQECPVVTSCGGGLYAHRYRAENGFANPSAYCPDLFKMISHIRHRMATIDATSPARDTPTYVMSGTAFQALAAGFGNAADMAQLTTAQRGLSRQLLAGLFQAVTAASRVLPSQVTADADAAWMLLTKIDQDEPYALDSVLAHPYLRAWAVRCLGQLRELAARGPAAPRAEPGSMLSADPGHLGAVAITAAIRAGMDAVTTAPVTDDAVCLPGLGRLKIAPEDARPAEQSDQRPGRAVIDLARDTVTIQARGSNWVLGRSAILARQPAFVPADPAGPAAQWQPVRMLTAPGLSVALEDTDPYRDCHQWPAAPRLTAAEHGQWQHQFREAWQQVRQDYPQYEPAIAASLTVIMPLQPDPDGRDTSAAARDAFGAIGVARPAASATLALLIMHEFQHVKLGAILDQYDLCDPADRRLFDAPWRTDRRPLEGLLQGTYAHLAVTDYWRQRQVTATGAATEEASEQFSRWHAHTRDAIDTLAASGSLTSLGEMFVEQMRHSMHA